MIEPKFMGTFISQGHEETRLGRFRRLIEEQYKEHSTGCGSSFEELLCWEIHENSMTFSHLAKKWRITLDTLGELIWDHCKRLDFDPKVNHNYERK